MVSMVRNKWDNFVAQKGYEPKEIYMSKDDLKEYETELGGRPKFGFYGGTYFRGIEIKEINEKM
jgi:hypothetical protein